MHITMRVVAACVLLAGGIAGTRAQEAYPSKTIRIIVPTSPGGVTDILARSLGQSMSQAWGRTVVVENRVGGNELIGTGAVAKAPPDGYTLLVTGSMPITGAPHLQKQMPFDPMKDLTLLVPLAEITPMMHVPASSPIKSVQEFIAAAKANPEKFNYGSFGNGTYAHLAMEDFKQRTGIKVEHIAYKGSSPAVNALLKGEISVLIVNLANVAEQIKQGNIRTIASAASHRASMRPDIPTIAEAGVPGFSTGSWWGMFGPANLPPDVVAKIRNDAGRILDSPDIRKLFDINTLERMNLPVSDYGKFLREDLDNVGKQMRAAGIQPE
jgi:tripartite-type tricarboxylate transporter receptor subunit TctC